MAGLTLNMGLGGGAGYSGPVFGGDGGAAAVPASGGYPDTGNDALLYSPSGVSGGGRSPHGHALVFGLACFGLLIFMAWALPR